MPRDQALSDARVLLERVGMTHRADAYPRELSGGEQQRVAIARALANRPALILADEPTGNLDTRRSEEIGELLKGLNRREGLTIILVTHNPALANIADRIIELRDGAIYKESWSSNREA